MEQRYKNGIAFALGGGFLALVGLTGDGQVADLIGGVGICAAGLGVLLLVVALATPRRD